MNVKYIDLGAQWLEIRERAIPEIDRILSSGNYLEHEVVGQLESELANFLQVKHVVTLNSGTDALMLSLKVLGISSGDEVITVPNSFVASAAAIEHVGAKAIFTDVGEDHLIKIEDIESKITSKTRAIMPVHLEGKMADMPRIKSIADKFDLLVIEDAAQAIGTTFQGVHPGFYSDIACFSLHPLKNLNSAGDGGFIATNNKEHALRISQLRNHGQETRNKSREFGFVSRLDSIQAAILLIKLEGLNSVIGKRKINAAEYDKAFESTDIKIPFLQTGVSHSYHLYVVEIENRDQVQQELLLRGIETKVHYPSLIPDQIAFKAKYGSPTLSIPNARNQVKRILSLPINHNLSAEQISYVCENLKDLSC